MYVYHCRMSDVQTMRPFWEYGFYFSSGKAVAQLSEYFSLFLFSCHDILDIFTVDLVLRRLENALQKSCLEFGWALLQDKTKLGNGLEGDLQRGLGR